MIGAIQWEKSGYKPQVLAWDASKITNDNQYQLKWLWADDTDITSSAHIFVLARDYIN